MFRFRHRDIGTVAIFWLTITLTLASGVMGTVAWIRLSRSADALAEAERVRESVNQLFSTLHNVEISQRGFLLTGKEAYFDAFLSADRAVSKLFNMLSGEAAISVPNSPPSHPADWRRFPELVESIEVTSTQLLHA